MENTWTLTLIVFITQIVFLYGRTWNVSSIAEKDMKGVILSGIAVHLSWLVSIAIGAYSMQKILLEFNWADIPVILGSLSGGLYGSYMALKKKIKSDEKKKALASEKADPQSAQNKETQDQEELNKIAFNYLKNKFFWPKNYEKFVERIQHMYFFQDDWLKVQNSGPANLPYSTEGITLKEAILMVDQFHQQFNLKMGTDKEVGMLNYDLMSEELREYRDAVKAGDPIAKLDAVTDMLYILLGIIRKEEFQNIIEIAFAEVHSSNLSKADKDGKPMYRHDGKLLKGPNFKEPRLAEVYALKL